MGRLLGVPVLSPTIWPNLVNAKIAIHNNKGHSISGTEVPERPRVTRGTRPRTTGHHHHRLGALSQTIGVTSSPELSYTPLAAYPKRVPPRGARAKNVRHATTSTTSPGGPLNSALRMVQAARLF